MSKKTEGTVYILLGLVLILVISVIMGPEESLVQAIEHFITDITSELLVHIYMVGVVLMVIGLVKYYSKGKAS